MSKFHSPWRKRKTAHKPPGGPSPRGGAGNHFPWWVTPAQAQNHLSFLDLEIRMPDLAKRMANDKRYMPDRYTFKKVRSYGSPKWGRVASTVS